MRQAVAGKARGDTVGKPDWTFVTQRPTIAWVWQASVGAFKPVDTAIHARGRGGRGCGRKT
jgi:hypothetical protein